MPNLVPVFEEAIRNLPAVSAEAQGRVIFGVDATASRQLTWEAARIEQARMFRSVVGVKMQLVYYRGGIEEDAECQHSRWVDKPDSLTRKMASIVCVAGETQIERVLRHAARENRIHPVAGLMFVGDMHEENPDDLIEAARAGKVRCFMFQEGNDIRTESLFKTIAEVTGGAYAKFGTGKEMGGLMTLVGQYATGRLAPASGAPTYTLPGPQGQLPKR